MSGLLCSGNVQIALLGDDGTFTGYMGVKNTVKLEIASADSNEKTRNSKMIENFGVPLDTVYAPGADKLTIDLDEHDADIAGLCFRGTVQTLTAAAIVAQEVSVPVVKGVWQPIQAGAYGLTDVAVVEDTVTDPATYTLGTDYQLDAAGGMILFPEGTTITDDHVNVTISAPAIAGKRVRPATRTTLRCRIFGRMKNMANGRQIILNIPDASLFPSSPVDFLADEFAVASVGVTMKSVNGADPYTIDYL